MRSILGQIVTAREAHTQQRVWLITPRTTASERSITGGVATVRQYYVASRGVVSATTSHCCCCYDEQM